MMIVTILQRIPYSPVVVPTVLAASARLGPAALGTVLARCITKTCRTTSTTTTTHGDPDTIDDHSFDVFDGVTKHFDALGKREKKNPLEKCTGKKIDTSAFLSNDPFDENETLTKAARLYETVHKVTKQSEVDRRIKTNKAATKSSSCDTTIVHTEEWLVTNPFDENEAYEKAVRAAERAKHFQPPKAKFEKRDYVVENAFDANETATKLSRAQEKAQV